MIVVANVMMNADVRIIRTVRLKAGLIRIDFFRLSVLLLSAGSFLI